MMNRDNAKYYNFTSPKRVHRAMETLEGYLKGIAADNEINMPEVNVLKAWLKENQYLVKRPPFSELASVLETVFDEGVISSSEHDSLLTFCKMFEYQGDFYDETTSDIQILQGMLGGITADNIIKKVELERLKKWMNQHKHLKTYWPFDEIDSLVIDVLEDGIIDDNEHKLLMKYFDEFSGFANKRKRSKSSASKTVVGVCAIDPKITFQKNCFCFTGCSE